MSIDFSVISVMMLSQMLYSQMQMVEKSTHGQCYDVWQII